MFFPLIGARLHGWLDDIVTLIYLLGAAALGLQGAARLTAFAGAAAHFLLTRFTDYPQGTFKLIPFRVHAFIELAEGAAVAVAAGLLASPPLVARAFLVFMGASQLVAFAFSDYGERPAARAGD